MRTVALALGVLASAGLGCEKTGPSAAEAGSTAEVTSPPAPRPQWPAWGVVPWPHGDDSLAADLRQAQLDRDPNAEAIERAWHHQDPAWRAESAWTLGRIGGPVARDRFIERLGDGRIELDAAALAAVSFVDAPGADDDRDPAWDELEDALWSRYAVAEDLSVADALLLAIARVGGERSPVRLAADLTVLPSAEELDRHVHAMESLAILCVRGHALPVVAVESVALGLGSPDDPLRAASAYTLARCAAVSAEQLAGQERGKLVERLVPLTVAMTPEVTRRAWMALEGLGELPEVIPGSILGSEPVDWMTEVSAVRALAAHADGRKVLARRLSALSLDDVQGPRLHALRDVLARLRPYAAHEAELDAPLVHLRDALVTARRASRDDETRSRALTLVNCEVLLLLATRNGKLAPLQGCARTVPVHGEHYGEALVIEALLHMGSALPREERDAMLLGRAEDKRPAVAAAAVPALAELAGPTVAPTLRAALARDDMGVVAAAAGVVAARASDQARRDPEAVEPLLAVLRRFDDAHAVETRIAALDALGRLARSEPKAADGSATTAAESWMRREIVPLAKEPAHAVRAAARRTLRGHPELLRAFDVAVPERFEGGFSTAVHTAAERYSGKVSGLRLHTERGVITIDFSGAPAPITQANLAALADDGFFDGLGFHRVVPGFVIQGGDPRGDGYGGPGHVMPCEWSNLRYERGTVGIALAGKDTGGSQLFIAHEATRHLDARYTVIGRVVEGMDVVDSIWPHDRITKAELITP